MDWSKLREELKSYEAEFKRIHLRPPDKTDIKANPVIADKYKRYSQSKSSSASSSSKKLAQQDRLPTSVESQADIFKTPTKPRRTKISASPSKTAPPSKPDASTTTRPATSYIIANSPSKLRALAAAYATSSPNHPNPTITNPISEFVVVGSPKKYQPSSRRRPPSPQRLSRDVSSGEVEGEKRWERVFSGALPMKGSTSKPSVNAMDVDVDDVLGPSPVKPAANGVKVKEYRPLFDLTPASTSNPFQAAHSTTARATASTSTIVAPSVMSGDHPSLQPLRGVKRSSTTPLPFHSDLPAATVNEVDDSDGEEDGGTNKKGKGKGKGKATKTTTGGAKPKPKPKKVRRTGPVEDAIVELNEDGRESNASLRRRNEKDIIILEVGDDEDETGQKKSRVLIHPRRPYYQKKYHVGESDQEEEDEDNEGDGTIDDTGSLYYKDGADLLASDNVFIATPLSPRLSNTSDSEERGESGSDDDSIASPRRPAHPVQHVIDSTAIPSSMLSILSLRSSPVKKTSMLREKDRDLRVERLLLDPLERNKKSKGLADLIDEDEQSRRGRADADSDDDWASDVEGWKDLGDGEMDDYDLSS